MCVYIWYACFTWRPFVFTWRPANTCRYSSMNDWQHWKWLPGGQAISLCRCQFLFCTLWVRYLRGHTGFLQTRGITWWLLLTDNPVLYADCREILLPMMTDQLKYHLERQEDLEACCQLLSNILEVLYRKDVVSHGDQTPGSLTWLPCPSLGNLLQTELPCWKSSGLHCQPFSL